MSTKSYWMLNGCFVSCLLVTAAMTGCKEEQEPAGGGGSGACVVPTAGMAAPTPLGGIPGCEAAVAGTPAQLHTDAMNVLNAPATCSFGSCHTPEQNKAGLTLLAATDLRTLLVDKPSCQAPVFPLVKGGCGDDALMNSWLWIKLVAPADASGVLTADPAWGAPVPTCDQMGGQPFGIRMPWSGGPTVASEARLGPIRNWICAGSPGPM